jgi:hypothetical protein
MAEMREQVNIEDEGEYTLEAILAEYKSEAFMKNERRLSREELEKQAEAIIREMRQSVERVLEEEIRGGAIDEPEVKLTDIAEMREADAGKGLVLSEENTSDTQEESEQTDAGKEPVLSEEAEEITETPIDDKAPEQAPAASEAEPETVNTTDAPPSDTVQYIKRNLIETGRLYTLQKELNNGRELYASSDAAKNRADEIERALKKEEMQKARIDARRLKDEARQRQKAARLAEEEEKRKKRENQPELSISEALEQYAPGIPSLKRRTVVVFFVCAVMALLLISERAGMKIPLLLPADRPRQAITFLSLQLFTMLMGIDILVAGVEDIFRGRLTALSLIAVACLASIVDAMMIIINKADWVGQPYSAAASCSLLFGMLGTKMVRTAWKVTLRTLKSAKLPTTVTAEKDRIDNGTVLCRHLGSTNGFINKCGESSLNDRVYIRLAPLLIISSLLFALVADVMNGGRTYFHCLAALTAISASFTSTFILNKPFSETARHLADYGAVIAGWNGAQEISTAAGIVIRDNDLFPENTISLNGVKFLSGASAEKVISYTGSIILASGSGLSRIFGELLREYACSIYRVEEFSCYEGGGIGAMIKGNNVLVGTPAFMNLMGIRLPPNLDVAGAVYTAIDGELAGVFIINYTPVDMVQNALVTLIRSDITPLYIIRDFNISPVMLKNKFKISADKINFLPFTDRYMLSSDSEGGASSLKPAAVMSREGLGHFVELTQSGRRFVKTVKRSMLLTIAGCVLGLLIVFYALANSAFASASAGNVLLFMALWAAAVVLLSDAS